jgi:hypothetical protein
VQRAEDAVAGFADTPATEALRTASRVLLDSAIVPA